jgi:3-oxoacyl-[acyl-carrier protein] reductase
MADFSQRIGLQDKVAIVIGGGRGIGGSCSVFLAEAGAHVALLDSAASRAESVAAEIRATGRRALPIVADAWETDQVGRTVEATLAEFGRIDVLVNDVGLSTVVLSEDLSEETWDSDILHNLKYAWRYCKAVAKVMMDQQRAGSIVNIGSMSGVTAAPYHCSYGAAKAGLSSVTRTLAVEWGKHGIFFNGAATTEIYTPRIQEYFSEDAEFVVGQSQRVPLGRWGRPEDIAGAVVFLASDLCPYITGQTIVVDGAFLINQLSAMGT